MLVVAAIAVGTYYAAPYDRGLKALLVEDADDKLFEAVLRNPEHTLHSLLPERRHDNTTTKET